MHSLSVAPEDNSSMFHKKSEKQTNLVTFFSKQIKFRPKFNKVVTKNIKLRKGELCQIKFINEESTLICPTY